MNVRIPQFPTSVCLTMCRSWRKSRIKCRSHNRRTRPFPILSRRFSRGGNSRGDPAVSARARFRAHSCTNRRRPSAYSSRAVHRTLKLGILWWSHSQQNLLNSEPPLQGRAVPRTLKPVMPSLAFLTFLWSSGCRDNVENQWARRAELRTGRSLPFTRSVRGTAVC